MIDDDVSAKNTCTVHAPIVYGSIAFWLGRKADESATHRWTLYVRGPNGEDISYFVSKVVFFLHESFAQSVRSVTNPPFEVTESGWGEFDARIRIFFKDARENPVEITHPLKLYPPGNTPPVVKRPVIHEFYDEVVFTDPSPEFLSQMIRDSQRPAVPNPMGDYFSIYDDSNDIQKILAAQHLVSSELNSVKEEHLKTEAKKAALREKISEVSSWV